MKIEAQPNGHPHPAAGAAAAGTGDGDPAGGRMPDTIGINNLTGQPERLDQGLPQEQTTPAKTYIQQAMDGLGQALDGQGIDPKLAKALEDTGGLIRIRLDVDPNQKAEGHPVNADLVPAAGTAVAEVTRNHRVAAALRTMDPDQLDGLIAETGQLKSVRDWAQKLVNVIDLKVAVNENTIATTVRTFMGRINSVQASDTDLRTALAKANNYINKNAVSGVKTKKVKKKAKAEALHEAGQQPAAPATAATPPAPAAPPDATPPNTVVVPVKAPPSLPAAGAAPRRPRRTPRHG